MNNTKLDCSLNDTTILRKLILENSELPVLIFCGEDAYNDDYSYTQAYASKCEIETLTLHGETWLTEEDYRDKLADDLSDEEEYVHLSNVAYDDMIEQKVSRAEFVKAIVVWVG